MKYYGNEKGGFELTATLGTVTTNDRFGLIRVDGADYQNIDMGMCMLQPHKLYAAQGFPYWYVIDRDYRGNKYAKDKQVARCGNAVPPPFADACPSPRYVLTVSERKNHLNIILCCYITTSTLNNVIC